MPKTILYAFLFAIAFFPGSSRSQGITPSEFNSNNDLIYSDTTIVKIKAIIEKENLKYKHCDLWKEYYALPQGVCNYVFMDTGNIQAAKKDLDRNIGVAEFSKKYPTAKIEKNRVFIKYKTQEYDGQRVAKYELVEVDSGENMDITFKDTSIFEKQYVGKWVYEFQKNHAYFKNGLLIAFNIVNETPNKKLPEQYEKMVQYVDCMIDTNSTIFFHRNNKKLNGNYDEFRQVPSLKMLANYVDSTKPRRDDYRNDSLYYSARYKWERNKYQVIDVRYGKNSTFISLVKNAERECLLEKTSTEVLEYFAAKYDTRENALRLKRSRIVMGGCSQDEKPRLHAFEIAKLSAETNNWDIFLRAHLDIMNDNFSRVSDGSWAKAQRKTYIKELEVLGIDVPTLILGISLRIANPSGNHYFGSIGRLGRAMSESKNVSEFEQKITGMISDKNLDDYNRILAFYLYKNYLYYIDNKKRKSESISLLKKASHDLPPYISNRLKLNDIR